MQPLVSIIIPTYNRAHLIGETLDSVLAQTYTNWECIVVDDGSKDYTDELMEFCCEQDNRIQYYQRPKDRPKGANACRNYGFEVSKGEYIQWLDSDDLISENKIEEQLKSLVNFNIDIVFCDYQSFDFNFLNSHKPNIGLEFGLCNTLVELIVLLGKNKKFLPPSCYLCPRSTIIIVGGWNEYLKVNQDGEFFVRLLLNCSTIKFIENSKVYYREDINEERVSSYDSLDKAEHAVLSWKLIEVYLKLKDLSEANIYLEYGKRNIVYTLLKTGYTNVINNHIDFFLNQLIPNNWIKKIIWLFKRRIKSSISIWSH